MLGAAVWITVLRGGGGGTSKFPSCGLCVCVGESIEGRRALVVKCFPSIHRKVTGSNHSGLAIHKFSFGLVV